jgi:hypothetical protein
MLDSTCMSRISRIKREREEYGISYREAQHSLSVFLSRSVDLFLIFACYIDHSIVERTGYFLLQSFTEALGSAFSPGYACPSLFELFMIKACCAAFERAPIARAARGARGVDHMCSADLMYWRIAAVRARSNHLAQSASRRQSPRARSANECAKMQCAPIARTQTAQMRGRTGGIRWRKRNVGM